MLEADLIHKRIDHQDDPERCQRGTPHGPCPYKHVEGSEFCAVHGGAFAHRQNLEKSKRVYLAAQWQAQSGQFADDPEIKSLRQEIGIIRMLLQKTMARCQTENDLLMRASTITDLIGKIERLVLSCNTLDTKLGVMLDKTQLQQFGEKVVALVCEFIDSPEIIDKFTRRLVETIQGAGTPEERGRTALANSN